MARSGVRKNRESRPAQIAPGEIVYQWVDTQEHFDDVLSELLDVDRYALDTEFHRERTYWPKLALVQVAW